MTTSLSFNRPFIRVSFWSGLLRSAPFPCTVLSLTQIASWPLLQYSDTVRRDAATTKQRLVLVHTVFGCRTGDGGQDGFGTVETTTTPA